jgi:hypothetical protein
MTHGVLAMDAYLSGETASAWPIRLCSYGGLGRPMLSAG